MANVFDVAEYILNKIESPVTTMKLQKLVYYCQAWSLAWDDKPLFDQEFEAWANGPVCRELFNYHKGNFEVNKGFFEDKLSSEKFSQVEIDTIDSVIDFYGDKDPHWLSELTHKEDPWRYARKGCSDFGYCDNVIPKVIIQEYYSSLV